MPNNISVAFGLYLAVPGKRGGAGKKRHWEKKNTMEAVRFAEKRGKKERHGDMISSILSQRGHGGATANTFQRAQRLYSSPGGRRPKSSSVLEQSAPPRHRRGSPDRSRRLPPKRPRQHCTRQTGSHQQCQWRSVTPSRQRMEVKEETRLEKRAERTPAETAPVVAKKHAAAKLL